MTIAPAAPSSIVQLIDYLGFSASAHSAIGTSSILEGGFYASIRATSSRPLQIIQEITLANLERLQQIFNISNAISITIYTKKLLDELKERYNISFIDIATLSVSGLLAGGTLIATAWGVGKTSSYFFKKGDRADVEEESATQKVVENLHATKLVLTVALAVFSQNYVALFFTITATGYSFFKNRQLSWLNCKASFLIDNQFFSRIDLHYRFPSIPVPQNSEDCTICLQENPDRLFHDNHLFHAKCIQDLINNSPERYIPNYNGINRTRYNHYYNGSYTHSSCGYSVTVSKESLPICPLCRGLPSQGDLKVSFEDREFGLTKANVYTYLDQDHQAEARQEFLERLNASYSTFQALLAYLQRYPELSSSIYTLQSYLTPIDAISYFLTIAFVHQKISAQYGSFAGNLFSVTALLTAIASYFALKALNNFLTPIFALKDLLNEMGISADQLDNTKVSWSSPGYHLPLQMLYFNRAFATFALSFFSNQKKLNLFSSLMQLGSLAGISQLYWIDFTQTLTDASSKILASGGSIDFGLNRLSSLEVTTLFMANLNCIKDRVHLSSLLEKIYDYSTKILNGSYWQGYWDVSYYNGIETGRTLIYEVTLQARKISACACSLSSKLFGIFIEAPTLGYYTPSVEVICP